MASFILQLIPFLIYELEKILPKWLMNWPGSINGKPKLPNTGRNLARVKPLMLIISRSLFSKKKKTVLARITKWSSNFPQTYGVMNVQTSLMSIVKVVSGSSGIVFLKVIMQYDIQTQNKDINYPKTADNVYMCLSCLIF